MDHTVIEMETAELTEALESLRKAPWGPWVRSDDPRFADLLPPDAATVADLAARGLPEDHRSRQALCRFLGAVPHLERHLANLADQSLEHQLLDLACAAGKHEESRGRYLVQRLQWDGGAAPVLLDELGSSMGISRERVRQLVERLLFRLPQGPPFLPALDRAIELVTRALPLSAQRMAELLRETGIAEGEWSPWALLQVAADLHRAPEFTVINVPGDGLVVATALAPALLEAIDAALDHLGRTGVSHIDVLWNQRSRLLETPVTREDFEAALRASSRIHLDDEGWCWCVDRRVEALIIPARKLLAACPPMPMANFYQGVLRSLKPDRLDKITLPDVSRLQGYLTDLGLIQVGPDGLVRPAPGADVAITVLNASEARLHRMLLASPEAVVWRTDLVEAWERAGGTAGIVGILLAYTPIVEPVRKGWWGLRGRHTAE